MADQQDLNTTDRAVADGVVLFQRKRSRVWQARIRHQSGKWMVLSTGQNDFEQAKQAAIAKRDEILKLKSKGQVVLTRRFRDVAKLTIKRLEKELTDGVGKEVYRHYIQAIDNYLIPCFGNAHVDSIDGAKLRDLDTFRTTKLGRVANRSTVTTHNAALKRVFKVAVEKGFMPAAQVPDLVNKVYAPTQD